MKKTAAGFLAGILAATGIPGTSVWGMPAEALEEENPAPALLSEEPEEYLTEETQGEPQEASQNVGEETAEGEDTDSYTYRVDLSQKGVDIGEDLYGAFFEDINGAAYGGLYGELVENRSFEFFQTPVNNDPNAHTYSWSTAGYADMELMNTDGMNENNTFWIQVTAKGSNTGVRNGGYDGISVKEGENYKFSMYVKGDYSGGFRITLESGGEEVGAAEIEAGPAQEWTKVSAVVQSAETAEDASLCVRLKEEGTTGLDMISLFPEHTYNNRENGLRADLVQYLKDLNPAFLRFPGGCVIEGINLETAYDWKDSVGPVEERPIMQSYWAQAPQTAYYYQEYGLGFYEYFLLCEDMGCEPLPCINAGCTHFWGPELAPLDQMQPYIDNALDLIEFANGDPSDPEQEWAQLRAEMGHPEPFNLQYLEVGNEQAADERYYERYEMFAEQVNEKYPEIKLLSSVVGLSNGPGQSATEWLKGKGRTFSYANDEHFYMSPEWFFENAGRYDVMERGDDAYIFAGEYASHHEVNGQKREDLLSAISEAAFMTGFERNGDIVKLTCYAPLFCKLGHQNWDPDLIWFDNEEVYGSPSYHANKMYATNTGDYTFAESVSAPGEEETSGLTGKVGVGTWNTTAVYDDLQVIDNETGEILYENDFETEGIDDWTDGSGNWSVTEEEGNQVLKQWDAGSNNNSIHAGDTSWKNYTYRLRAKKLSGLEGFIIPFAVKDRDNYLHYNLGGFANTYTAVEHAVNGAKTTVATSDTIIETNRWYDIEIQVEGERFRCYLDGELDCEGVLPKSYGPVYTTSGFDEETGDVILKLVNGSDEEQSVDISLENNPYEINPNASMIQLAYEGTPDEENSIEEPDKIVPANYEFTGAGDEFSMELPSYSFTILRLHTLDDSQVIASAEETEIQTEAGVVPELPQEVTVTYADGSTGTAAVRWEEKPESFYQVPGRYVLEGRADGYNEKVRMYIEVLEEILDTGLLESLIAEAQGLSAEEYTHIPQLYKEVKEALSQAEALLTEEDLTQEKIDGQAELLQTALEQLKTADEEAKEDFRKQTVEVTLSVSKGSQVEIQWTPVKNAGSYGIYRKEDGDSEYQLLKAVGKDIVSYVDKKAETGRTYCYMVKGYWEEGAKGISTQDSAEGVVYLPMTEDGFANVMPRVSAKAGRDSVTVNWETVKEARSYRIYRKEAGGSFKGLATVAKDVTSYVDETAEAGVTYYYTVKGFREDKAQGTCTRYPTDVTAKIAVDTLAMPKVKTRSVNYCTVEVSWNKVTGADKYVIYRKEAKAGTAFKSISTVSGDTLKYRDGSAKMGVNYYYTVKAYAGSNYSDYQKTVTGMAVPSSPTLKAAGSSKGVTVTWTGSKAGADKFADGYRIFRKTGNGSWKTVGTVGANTRTFTDTTGTKGTTYYYTVRAYVRQSDGTNLWGTYDTTGVTGAKK